MPNRSYSTFDWGIRDDEALPLHLGRTDDVINVAGTAWHARIEESLSATERRDSCGGCFRLSERAERLLCNLKDPTKADP